MIRHPDLSYQITTDPEEMDSRYRYGPDIEDMLDKFYRLLNRKNKKVLPQLLKAIKKYPRIPALRNYLCVYYESVGNLEKAMEVNRRIVTDHPDYVFARLNIVSDHLRREEYEQARAILGPDLDLQAIFPERKVFHLTEFEQFWFVVGEYYSGIENFPALVEHLQLGRDILGPDHPKVEFVSGHLVSKMMRQHADDFLNVKEQEENDPFTARGYDKAVQTEEVPQLKHQELLALNEMGLDRAEHQLSKLLRLPRASLMEDLEKILRDSIVRYEYWDRTVEVEDRTNWSPIFAILLLRMADAKEQLPLILDLFRQGEELLDFWFGDWVTEELWRMIYPLAVGQDALLLDFLREPHLYTYSKILVAEALIQRALHQPEEEAKVVSYFVDLIDFLLENKNDDTILDRTFNSLLCVNLTGIAAPPLAQRIQQLYDEDLVWKGGGYSPYSELEEDFATEKERNFQRNPLYLDNPEYLRFLQDKWVR